MSRARSTAFCLVIFTALGSPLVAEPNDLVVIWLEDGRTLAGKVGPRTDDERLWLRSTAPAFVIATSAAWENIEAVKANGTRLSAAAFAKRVDQFRPRPADTNALPLPARGAEANVATVVTRPAQQRNAATRVASLDVEARVANWDEDAATDGIEIRVVPKNTLGELVPGSGQIIATLIARHPVPAHDPDAFPQLGRWSLQADSNDFGASGAVYRLPFRRQHPDTESSLEPFGLVEVSFYISGQGRFTSDATIHLRQFNPVRHNLQRQAADRDR